MTDHKPIYVIGEIGQNHNGSVDIAKLIVDAAARPVNVEIPGLQLRAMDAVKLVRRDLKKELSASQMEAPHSSVHSFGRTYGEHRAKLELNDEQHFEIYQYAKSRGLDFIETLCAPGCLSLLKLFCPDYLKVASRDLTNLPLLEAMAETRIPIILSTGMAGKTELDEALNVISKKHSSISILHCVSQYPTHPDHTNLMTIPWLMKTYPQYVIGYSDHTIGLSAPIAACALGARIIEKHITLDRRMKGTDQAGSLGPDGINRMLRDIRELELALGKEVIFVDPSVEAARGKLERSVAAKRLIRKGETITENDIHLLSPGDGVKWRDRACLIGKQAMTDIPADEIISKNLVE